MVESIITMIPITILALFGGTVVILMYNMACGYRTNYTQMFVMSAIGILMLLFLPINFTSQPVSLTAPNNIQYNDTHYNNTIMLKQICDYQLQIAAANHIYQNETQRNNYIDIKQNNMRLLIYDYEHTYNTTFTSDMC